uniref:Lectin-24A n=1 Tax=Drosophila simulans TaxID=7240 RepID=G3LSU2_DROSI|nr:lectin-24A [Drosophila simulans]AEN94459.1 lectin-24A [Drosophila simulans]AEN94460.1 lectin-24A [Drosophila simulans]AEN94461.1 lectin-24A [Drosophila simulans]AEN94462.1 lectin-24A [Drosophila simulans]
MLRLSVVVLNVLLVSHGSSAGTARIENHPKDMEAQCNGYCFSTLRPVMQYVAVHQDKWNTCTEIIANETVKDQNQLSVQLDALKADVSNIKASQLSKDNKLDRIEREQSAMQESLKTINRDLTGTLDRTKSQLEAIKNTMESMKAQMDGYLSAINEVQSTLDKKCIQPGFEKIGDRYFHIEEDVELNWLDAQASCRRMGGHLASIKNKQEFDAIVEKLDSSKKYFLGINDRTKIGDFVSAVSGKRCLYLKWSPGEPDHSNDRERCVSIVRSHMYVSNCTYQKRYICQLDAS